MNLLNRLESFLPDLFATLVRFPVPVLVAVATAVYGQVFDVRIFDDTYLAIGTLAFLASGAVHLFAEGRGLSRGTGLLLAALAALAAAAVGHFDEGLHLSWLMAIPALVLLTMVAPFLRRDAAQGALWLFNLRFGLASLLALVVGVAFGAGLSAIVAALDFLFEVIVPSRAYDRIWQIAVCLVGPVYGLTLIPRQLDEVINIEAQKGSLLERGVSVLVNYVVVPVIIAYALILHAYAVKIIVSGSLPKGQVATMVSIFAVAGTGAWLIAWPWRETGTRLLRLFMRHWFWFTIVPANLLAAGIWRRIADYGVTPDRYGIVLIAVWTVSLTAYLAFRRAKADMRAILGALALLLGVGALGPWGAHGVTVSSQISKLMDLAAKAGGLSGSTISGPLKDLTPDQKSSGYSMVQAIMASGGARELARLVPDADIKDKTDRWSLTEAYNTALGLSYRTPSEELVNLSANQIYGAAIPANASLYGPFFNFRAAKPGEPAAVYESGTDIVIEVGGKSVRIAIKSVLAQIKAGIPPGTEQKPVIVTVSPEITLVFSEANGRLTGTPRISYSRFWVIAVPATP